MSKLKSMLALAMVSAMAAESERVYGDKNEYKPYPQNSEPEWKRKKCKSCTGFHKYSSCSSSPNNQACSKYNKRKK